MFFQPGSFILVTSPTAGPPITACGQICLVERCYIDLLICYWPGLKTINIHKMASEK